MRTCLLLALTACGTATTPDDLSGDLAPDAALELELATCVDVDDTAAITIGTAAAADDHALVLPATAASSTRWGTAGNEALVLDVSTPQRLIGHLILHQGNVPHAYGMHLGALSAGEQVRVKVSTLSAPGAIRRACVGPGTLSPASSLPTAEGLRNAPIYRWPIQKRFDDVPLVLGWSRARKSYQTLFTNENGGTVVNCGGGASGVQAEIARWGRAADIEGSYFYGTSPRWQRCTGTVAFTTLQPRLEGAHPILYYGDGHNRLFEHRGGYGQTCGSGGAEKSDGNLDGWNTNNPGNALADDAGRVIILRPLPVSLDDLGFAQFGGRREALIDRHAPWLYRLTHHELARQNSVDNNKVLGMARYLYVDVRVADVGGSGDSYCSLNVDRGFRLRALTTTGASIDGPQITADYASGGAHDYKRVAIPLPSGVTAADISGFRFDAYDDDGIYLTALGDAFVPQLDAVNGATLAYVRQGEKPLSYYVDDDRSSCTNNSNTDGPGGTPYACTGSFVDVPK